MTRNDAQIAREWASKALGNDLLDEVPIEGYRAAARYILATTTPPTMADIAWDDEVHSGLCAEHPHYGLVRMLEYDHKDTTILCLTRQLRCEWSDGYDLTPIPGTKINLTRRREPVTGPTPDHPTWLTTEEDYRNAPEGTVVAGSEETPWTKWDDSLWKHVMYQDRDNYAMAGRPRRVLRWGWKA